MAASAGYLCLVRWRRMSKKPRKGLTRKTSYREYRKVFWISAEGKTERDYFSMNAFRGRDYSIRFPENIHPNRRNPAAVLKRFEKAMKKEVLRKGDEAWIVVDVDNYDKAELSSLYIWERKDARNHVAISNPKFELFLLMHFGNANGCTTPELVDVKMKKTMPEYDKRLSQSHFALSDIRRACEVARKRRASEDEGVPSPGATDVYKLVERLVESKPDA